MKKRSLLNVNEHFEHERNAEITLLDNFVRRNVNITKGCVSIREFNPHQQLKNKKRHLSKVAFFVWGCQKRRLSSVAAGVARETRYATEDTS